MSAFNKLVFCLILGLVCLTGCKHEVKYRDAQGNTILRSDLNGKWVVLNYWASWCNYCEQEVAEFNDFFKTKDDNVVLYGVNFDGLLNDELKKAASEFGIQYPVLQQDIGPDFGISEVTGIPATVIISPKGEVLLKKLGLVTKAELEKYLITKQDAAA